MKSLQLLMILAAGCVSATALAAEPKPAQPANPATTAAQKPGAESAAPAKDEVSKKDADEEAAAAKSPSAADKKSSPQRFVPSEQVRADFDVSFPIDI